MTIIKLGLSMSLYGCKAYKKSPPRLITRLSIASLQIILLAKLYPKIEARSDHRNRHRWSTRRMKRCWLIAEHKDGYIATTYVWSVINTYRTQRLQTSTKTVKLMPYQALRTRSNLAPCVITDMANSENTLRALKFLKQAENSTIPGTTTHQFMRSAFVVGWGETMDKMGFPYL